jgi:hypothetical protein
MTTMAKADNPRNRGPFDGPVRPNNPRNDWWVAEAFPNEIVGRFGELALEQAMKTNAMAICGGGMLQAMMAAEETEAWITGVVGQSNVRAR